jgi:enoyl-CoA hydratase/carnithine racemase
MRLGLNRGMELLLTGRTVSPTELKDWGVANSVVPADQVQEEALRYARAVAALSTDGLLLGKRAYQQFLHGMGLSAYQNFASVGHPLFTNIVWRDDEVNFLRERDKEGGKQTMQRLNKIWDDLGFK